MHPQDDNPDARPARPLAPELVVGEPVRVTGRHAAAWIVEGFELFVKRWQVWVVIMTLYLMTFVLMQALVQLTSSLVLGEVIGSLVLLPLMSGGIVIGFHWLSYNNALPVFTLFAGFVTRPGALIAGGALVYGLILLLVVFALTVSGLPAAEYLEFIRGQDPAVSAEMIGSPKFLRFMAWLTPLMIPATVMYYFTINQIALSRVPVTTALARSARAVMANLYVVFLAFALLLVLGLFALIATLMFFGALSVLPVDGTSSAGMALYSLLATVLIGAPVFACLFGINYAAFRSIFMRPLPDVKPNNE